MPPSTSQTGEIRAVALRTDEFRADEFREVTGSM
jgi:hypothetical protein